jgi:hypothetical protein
MSSRSVVADCNVKDSNRSHIASGGSVLPQISILERVIESVPTQDFPSLLDDFVTKGFSLLYQNSLTEFGAQLVTTSSVQEECITAVRARLQGVARGMSQSVLSLLEPTTSGLTEQRIQSTLRHGCFQVNLCSLTCFWQGIGTRTPPQWSTLVSKTLAAHPGFETPALRDHLRNILQERIKKFYVDLPGFQLRSAGLDRDFITLMYVGCDTTSPYEYTPERL